MPAIKSAISKYKEYTFRHIRSQVKDANHGFCDSAHDALAESLDEPAHSLLFSAFQRFRLVVLAVLTSREKLTTTPDSPDTMLFANDVAPCVTPPTACFGRFLRN